MATRAGGAGQGHVAPPRGPERASGLAPAFARHGRDRRGTVSRMVAPSRAAAAIAAWLALVAAACAPSEVRISWSIAFASDVPAADARASVVHASIRSGDCSSTEPVYTTALAFGETAPAPAALARGTWAFVGEAVDASCQVIASDCVAIVVPSGATDVHLVLHAIDPYPLCAPSECVAGRCGAVDAGVPQDAAPEDAASEDAGPGDAGPPDACGARESRCTDRADDDCDGATDCADADCEAVACGVESLCCSGACVDTASSNAHCGGCGAPCDTVARFTCTAGSCECQSGFMECAAGSCTNTQVSEVHCGMCGRACTPDLVCEDGGCGPDSATWSTSRRLTDCPSDLGATYQYRCAPNPTLIGAGTVWGTDIYYASSSICPAAVHAGRITAAGGGVVTVRVADGMAGYVGTTRNGVTTTSRSVGSCSFTFDP